VGFGEDQVSLGWFWGEIHVFCFFFSSRLVLFWGVFDVFWGLPWVLLGFNRVFWWLGVDCTFRRTSGRFKVILGVKSCFFF